MYLIFLLINLGLRLIYAFYGYIATEEGILIYDQALAYSGKLPFIDYNAYNSLFLDYLIGWQRFLMTPSILGQRLLGIGISICVFLLTIKLVKRLDDNFTAKIAALFMTLGSIRFVYSSSIPYSEQLMTLFVILSLSFLAPARRKPLSTIKQITCLLLAISAGLIRSQGLPIAGLIWLYLVLQPGQNRRSNIKLTFVGIWFTILVLFPFLVNGPQHVLWAFFWSVKADQLLIYQSQVGQLTLPQLIAFATEAARDYGVLVAITLSCVVTQLKLLPKPKRRLLKLLICIVAFHIATGLIHKPPYASYIYPAVPILSILASYSLAMFLRKLYRPQQIFILILLTSIMLTNIVTFPHAQFIKTSQDTLTHTPHAYLELMANYLKSVTSPQDEILSFYTPILTVAKRMPPKNLDHDRFSLTPLSTIEAEKFHLSNHEMLTNYISSEKASVIIFTDKSVRVFGTTIEDQQQTLAAIESKYYLAKTFSQINFVEDPKTRELYFYLRKNSLPQPN